jgi:hypothetical protein
VRSKLFNLDALFELTVGLILMLNPLLGPKFPISGGFMSLVGFACLVAAIFVGQAGMGKGPLVKRIATVGALNTASGLALALWALVDDGFGSGGVVFALVLAAGLLALGLSQIILGDRPAKPSRRRSTPAERAAAIQGRKP